MNKMQSIIDSLINTLLFMLGLILSFSCLVLGFMVFPELVARIDIVLVSVNGIAWGDFWVLDNALAWLMKTMVGLVPLVLFVFILSGAIFIAFKSFAIKVKWFELFRQLLKTKEVRR